VHGQGVAVVQAAVAQATRVEAQVASDHPDGERAVVGVDGGDDASLAVDQAVAVVVAAGDDQVPGGEGAVGVRADWDGSDGPARRPAACMWVRARRFSSSTSVRRTASITTSGEGRTRSAPVLACHQLAVRAARASAPVSARWIRPAAL